MLRFCLYFSRSSFLTTIFATLSVALLAQQPPQPAATPTAVPREVGADGRVERVLSPRDTLYAPVVTDDVQSQRERFMEFAVLTAGPRALITPLFSVGFRMLNPPSHYPLDWKYGATAFGQNYADALARRSAMQTAQYAVGAALREDFRYRPSVSHNPGVRLLHAIGYTFVDRSDSGHSRLAMANFAAAGAKGFVGMAYLPGGYNDISHAGSRAAIAFGSLAGQNVAREFAPDLFRLSRRLHLPFPRLPIPEWWVKR